MKKLLCGALAAVFLLCCPVLAAEDVPAPEAPAQPLSAPVLVDGQEHAAAVIVVEGKVFYRLRDVASALTGSPYAIDVTWDRQIFVSRGVDYSAPPLAPLTEVEGYVSDPQLVLVDGEQTTVNALWMDQHYYIPVRCLNKLTGAQAAEEDGALVFRSLEN